MKTIVEFGRPQSALPEGTPCGVSGRIVCESIKAGNSAAYNLRHVLSARQHSDDGLDGFMVSRQNPRITWWAADHSCWVTVTLLKPFYQPGDYAAVADRFAEIAKDI